MLRKFFRTGRKSKTVKQKFTSNQGYFYNSLAARRLILDSCLDTCVNSNVASEISKKSNSLSSIRYVFNVATSKMSSPQSSVAPFMVLHSSDCFGHSNDTLLQVAFIALGVASALNKHNDWMKVHYQSLLEFEATNEERQHRIFVEPCSDSIHKALWRNDGFLHSFCDFSKSNAFSENFIRTKFILHKIFFQMSIFLSNKTS